MFALSESGMLPKAFSRLHPRYRTPWIAVIVLGVLSCISPLFGRVILVWLINAGSMAVVVAYLFVPIAFLVLRWKDPDRAVTESGQPQRRRQGGSPWPDRWLLLFSHCFSWR